MATVNPYLHFNGTAKEAFAFYKECLGGDVYSETVGETPMKDKMPGGADSNSKVMHATLVKDGTALLLGSDMMDPKTFTPGDTISLTLNCNSEEELKKLFSKLSRGGKVTMPPSEQFWGATFGMLTDKFGIDWMLNYQKQKPKEKSHGKK